MPVWTAGVEFRNSARWRGNGRIGNVRQAQFAEDALLFLLRLVAEFARRKKTAEREFQHFIAGDGGFHRAADERRACAHHGGIHAFRRVA